MMDMPKMNHRAARRLAAFAMAGLVAVPSAGSGPFLIRSDAAETAKTRADSRIGTDVVDGVAEVTALRNRYFLDHGSTTGQWNGKPVAYGRSTLLTVTFTYNGKDYAVVCTTDDEYAPLSDGAVKVEIDPGTGRIHATPAAGVGTGMTGFLPDANAPASPANANVTVELQSARPQFTEGNANYSFSGGSVSVVSAGLGQDGVTGSTGRTPAMQATPGAFLVKLGEAPAGYAANAAIDEYEAAPGEDVHAFAYLEPYRTPVSALLSLRDGEMLRAGKNGTDGKEPQGDASFDGASFHVAAYASMADHAAGNDPVFSFDTTSVETADGWAVDFSESAVSNFRHNGGAFTKENFFVDGTDAFSFPLCYLVITLTQAPEGYTLEDPNLTMVLDKSPKTGALKASVDGPQYAFAITEPTDSVFLNAATLLPYDYGAESDTAEFAYLDAASLDALRADCPDSESADASDAGLWYAVRDDGTVSVHAVTPKVTDTGRKTAPNMDPRDFGDGAKNPTVDGFSVFDADGMEPEQAWVDMFAGDAADFSVIRSDADTSVLDAALLSGEDLDRRYGSDVSYAVRMAVEGFSYDAGGTGVSKNGRMSLKDVPATVRGEAAEIRFEAHPASFASEDYAGCYYFVDTYGDKNYLTYRPAGYGVSGITSNLPVEWGGVPMVLTDVSGNALPLAEDSIEKAKIVETRCVRALDVVAGQFRGTVSSEPFLIPFSHDLTFGLQVKRQDLFAEVFDFEKDGPEETAGGSLGGTYALFNVSGHAVYDPVGQKTVLNNELFALFDARKLSSAGTWAAFTENGRLPYGTYSLRAWAPDTDGTYHVTDFRARIIESRENARITDAGNGSLAVRACPEDFADAVESWKTEPYKGDDYAELWKDAGSPGKRGGAESGYAREADAGKWADLVITAGRTVRNESTEDNQSVQDESLAFKHFPVRADLSVSGGPSGGLVVLKNGSSGETHVALLDSDGALMTSVDKGRKNALDPLLGVIDAAERNGHAFRAWPKSVKKDNLAGEVPDEYFDIDEGGRWSWKEEYTGGVWFSQGKSGSASTFVSEYEGDPSDPAAPAWVQGAGGTGAGMFGQSLASDMSQAAGIPSYGTVRDRNSAMEGWDAFAAGGIVNGFFIEGDGHVRNADADTSSGHVTFEKGDVRGISADARGIDTRKADLVEHAFGALTAGTYVLRNTGNLLEGDVYDSRTFAVSGTGGADVDLSAEEPVDPGKPSLVTAAMDEATGAQVTQPDDDLHILDRVTVTGLKTGQWYVLKGSLYNSTVHAPVTDAKGNGAAGYLAFEATGDRMELSMPFGSRTVGAKMYADEKAALAAAKAAGAMVRGIPVNGKLSWYLTDASGSAVEASDTAVTADRVDALDCSGHRLVVYEQLYGESGNLLVSHSDENDEAQAVYLGSVDTKAHSVADGDEQVSDSVSFTGLKPSAGDTGYVAFTAVVGADGRVVTGADTKLYTSGDQLRGDYGKTLPVGEDTAVSDYFTPGELKKGKYYLKVALYDETAGDYVYDRRHADGSLLYAGTDGHGVFDMKKPDGSTLRAWYNPVDETYRAYPDGTEWKSIEADGLIVGMLSGRTANDQSGGAASQSMLVTPLLSKPMVRITELDETASGRTIETRFSVDTTHLSGHVITSREALYTQDNAAFDLFLCGNDAGGYYPAAYQIGNIRTSVDLLFAEKEDEKEGILMRGAPYKITARLLDYDGDTLKDRYGMPVTWTYRNSAGSAANRDLYVSDKAGTVTVPVSFLSGTDTIGADWIFGVTLRMQVTAERGDGKGTFVVGEYPLHLNSCGGTSYKRSPQAYDAEGFLWDDEAHAEISYVKYPQTLKDAKDEWTHGWQSAGGEGTSFWDFYPDPSAYKTVEEYDRALAARAPYYYNLYDYTAQVDEAHTVRVDGAGTLTGVSSLPFVLKGPGQTAVDTVLAGGLSKGGNYTAAVRLYDGDTLVAAAYRPFEASDANQKVTVPVGPFTAAEGKTYTVQEEIRRGTATDGYAFASLEKEGAAGASHADKKLPVLGKLTFADDGDGNLVASMPKPYESSYITAQQVKADKAGAGSFTASVAAKASDLKAGGGELSFTSAIYMVNADGTYTPAGSHGDLTDPDEKLLLRGNASADKITFTTEAKADKGDGKRVLPKDGTVTVTDTVSYTGITDVANGTLKGTLVLKSTGNAVATAEKSVGVDASGKGTFAMELSTDVSRLSKGDALVVYEELYDARGELVASHKDISDEAQTIFIDDPKDGRSLDTAARVGNSQYALPSAGKVTLTDTVTYKGYEDYRGAMTLKGEVFLKSTGKSVAKQEKEVRAAGSGDGTWAMTFDIDLSAYKKGDALVVYEELFDADGNSIGAHKDMDDKDQTLYLDTDPAAAGANRNSANASNSGSGSGDPFDTVLTTAGGSKFLSPGGKSQVTDAVTFHGFDPGTYTVVGYLVRKSNGEVLTDASGEPITAKTTVKSADGSGTARMNFTFDSSIFTPGDSIVAFENLLDENGKLVASHLDINDPDQTVSFKKFTGVQTGIFDGWL